MAQQLTSADKRRCALCLRYQKLNVSTLRRVGSGPFISFLDFPEMSEWPDHFREPQISEQEDLRTLEVRVVDPVAVNLERDNLLGDWSAAVERCESLLRERGYHIIDSISDW